MRLITTLREMHEASDEAKRANRRMALVPTMGSLHEGHVALMRKARDQGAAVIVSVYVNPTQFGPKEDFEDYPRQLDADMKICRREQVDAVFAPSDQEMYPGGIGMLGFGETAGGVMSNSDARVSSTVVDEAALSRWLEGVRRPGHFRGVCTVVAKLFNIVRPDVAVFGQKDYQQLKIIQRMTRDLCYPIDIICVETVREPDGLALSSRNRRMSPEERAQATVLYKGLKFAEDLFNAGERNAHRLEAAVLKTIEIAPAARFDYAEVANAETLEPVFEVSRGDVVLVAAYVGKTRLIDNLVL